MIHGTSALVAGLAAYLGGRNLRRGKLLSDGHLVLSVRGGVGMLIVLSWFGPWRSNVTYHSRASEIGFYVVGAVVSLWIIAFAVLLVIGRRMQVSTMSTRRPAGDGDPVTIRDRGPAHQ